MGKRPAEDELFVGNMGSIQREIRTSMQREDKPTMETGLERIAAKARSEPKLRFTSLAHHLTRERVWTNLCQIPKRSAPGVDGQTVTDAKETFGEWVEPVLRSVHHQGYRAPDIMQVHVAQQDADRTALWGSLLVWIDLAVFQDACLQPAPDKADHARITNGCSTKRSTHS